MSAIWESANWTRQFGIRQTGNRQFGMLPSRPTHQPSMWSIYAHAYGGYTIVIPHTLLIWHCCQTNKRAYRLFGLLVPIDF
jgi:hypothetical protein